MLGKRDCFPLPFTKDVITGRDRVYTDKGSYEATVENDWAESHRNFYYSDLVCASSLFHLALFKVNV